MRPFPTCAAIVLLLVTQSLFAADEVYSIQPLPDSPGFVQQSSTTPASAQAATSPAPQNPIQPTIQQSTTPPASQPTQPQPAPPDVPQNREPVGTAAAPAYTPTGVTASRPAGAAIAPARQHRTRTILISLTIVAAAAVAIGVPIALASGSPSRK